MSLVLNTNVNAINSQNALNKSQMSLSQAMQRLSSGLRINSAADDAAGLAIATRMTTQVNGLTQGSQNANDGISLAQTAEGALSELNNNLQAIRTLAVESANATNSASDRAAIDQEVQQRLQEVDRIATQTTFNGQHVLDGTLGSATFQVGANVGETIGISLNTSMKTTSIGSLAQTATTASVASLFNSGAGLTLAANAFTVNGTGVAAGNYTTAASLVTAINTAAGSTIAAASGNEIAFTNTTGTAITFGGASNPLGITTVAAASTAGAGFTLAANALTVNGTAVAAATYTDANTLATAINTAWSTSGGSGTLASVVNNEIHIDNSDTAHTANFAGSAASGLGLGNVAAATPAGVTLATGDFTIGGTSITGSFATLGDLVSAITSAAITGIAASNNGGELELTNSSGAAVAIGGAFATTLGIASSVADGTSEDSTAATTAIPAQVDTTADSTGVNAAVTNAGTTTNGTATSTGVNTAVTATGTATPVTLATGDLTIKLGTGSAIDMAGTYDTSQDLADAINSKVSGMYASVDSSGALSLSAADAITVSGTKAGTGTGNFGFATTGSAIAVAGSLRGTDVLTVDDANNMIQRIDSALTAVNNYNSVLGAIQNRFQSTINSASAAAQNITAARSRIQDADFAAETTKMTSANILQQAGVSVLAQANSSQQSILKLLQ